MSKFVYVSVMRSVRRGVQAVGLLRPWNRWAGSSRAGCWSRSLLAVYDLQDLVALDVPWWTFAASSRVEVFLRSRPAARVFEWGSGASTVWLARRAVSVAAVEHDAAWADDVRSVAPSNAMVHLVPPRPLTGQPMQVASAKAGFAGLDFADYVAAIDSTEGMFDVIVIDGRAREACLSRAIDRLAPGGVIVFDNVDRTRYRDAITALKSRLQVEWTRGLTPCLPYPTRTALIRLSGQ